MTGVDDVAGIGGGSQDDSGAVGPAGSADEDVTGMNVRLNVRTATVA